MESDEAGDVMYGFNSFFELYNRGGKGHKMFTALSNKGITNIEVSTLDLNEGISGFEAMDGTLLRCCIVIVALLRCCVVESYVKN